MEAIFHEKQEGSLCAQHCLNALLQGPYFTAVDLADIARQLDEREREQMAEGGTNTEGYQRFLQQPSNNYDDSGFFSVQVIDTALRVWSLELLPYNSQNDISRTARDNPIQMKSYICNFGEHWLTVRKLGNQWFNLNSLLTGPELISDTYLNMFLTQLQQDGYSIFIVIGDLMECEADQLLRLCPAAQPIKPRLITDNSQSKMETTEGSGGIQDEDLGRVLKESKQAVETDDVSLQRALQMSMEGYIEESVTRIETACDTDIANSQTKSESDLNSDSPQTLGGATSASQSTGDIAPDVDEVRQRRLAFLNKLDNTDKSTNDSAGSTDSNASASSSDSVIKKTSTIGTVAPSDMSEEEMLKQAIAMSMVPPDT